MNKNLVTVILAVVLAGQLTISQGGVKIIEPMEIIDIISDVYETFKDIWDELHPQPTPNDILNAINDVAQNLKEFEIRFQRNMNIILDTMLKRLVEIIDIRSDMQLLRGYVQRIDSLYDEYRAFSTNCSDWNPATIREFFEKVTDHNPNSVAATLEFISSILYPGKTEVFSKSLILRMIRSFKESELDACDDGISVQQQMYDFYTTILVTELRGWLLISAAYTFRSSLNDTNSISMCSLSSNNTFIGEQRYALAKFHMRVGNYSRMFREAMASTSRSLRRCDPSDGHTRGKSFHEFERFISAYIVGLWDIAPYTWCLRSSPCEDVGVSYMDYTHPEFNGKWSKCNGGLTDRSTTEGDTKLCYRDDHPTRRYEWFMDGRENKYGTRNGQCNIDLIRGTDPRDGSYICAICRTTCTEDSYLHHDVTRSVSLREVVSDIDDNKVVTGIKFISSNNVIQLQIQQGKLAEDGRIETNSTSWKEPEQIQFLASESSGQKKLIFAVTTSFQNESIILKDSEDVAIFDRGNHEINLDELHVPKKHVMTGIKFDKDPSPHPGLIQLSIRATPFDYAKGKLVNKTASIWITPDNMVDILAPYKRKRERTVYGWDTKNPIEQVLKTKPDFEPNKSRRLTKTGLLADAGQTVIPLLDGLEVMANPAVPLGGVSLFHKSADDYGGFLSFRILSIDRDDDMFFVKFHNPEKSDANAVQDIHQNDENMRKFSESIEVIRI